MISICLLQLHMEHCPQWHIRFHLGKPEKITTEQQAWIILPSHPMGRDTKLNYVFLEKEHGLAVKATMWVQSVTIIFCHTKCWWKQRQVVPLEKKQLSCLQLSRLCVKKKIQIIKAAMEIKVPETSLFLFFLIKKKIPECKRCSAAL